MKCFSFLQNRLYNDIQSIFILYAFTKACFLDTSLKARPQSMSKNYNFEKMLAKL